MSHVAPALRLDLEKEAKEAKAEALSWSVKRTEVQEGERRRRRRKQKWKILFFNDILWFSCNFAIWMCLSYRFLHESDVISRDRRATQWRRWILRRLRCRSLDVGWLPLFWSKVIFHYSYLFLATITVTIAIIISLLLIITSITITIFSNHFPQLLLLWLLWLLLLLVLCNYNDYSSITIIIVMPYHPQTTSDFASSSWMFVWE